MKSDKSKAKNKETDKNEKNNKTEEVNQLKNQVEDYKSRYLRALADYQNLEKRAEEQKQEIIIAANRNFISKLLPFLDNLEKAQAFVNDPGLKIIKDQFLNLLKNEGLEEIDILGKEYDPHVAEAIDIVAGDKDNEVCEVVRKGYKFNDRVIQTAHVKVTKKAQ